MPVTKTAKRALRASFRKSLVNKKIIANLEAKIRLAKKGKSASTILAAISAADKAAKTKTIHKNKAARIKSVLGKLLPKTRPSPKSKKTTKK